MRAVIFDFDGTLVDSEPLHARALRSVFAAAGVEGAFDESAWVGLADAEVIRAVFARRGLELDEPALSRLLEAKSAAARTLWESGYGAPYPGAVDLVREVKRLGVSAGVCTAAPRREATPVLEKLGLTGLLDALVTADDVGASKPDPACYRLVCARLGASPAACVAIEDSAPGVAAASAAGCRVVGLGHTTARERLHGASWFFERIAEVRAGWLLARA